MNDRDIDTLLQLGTYQGMTDSEITSLINYAVNRATAEMNSSLAEAYQAGFDAAIKERVSDVAAHAKDLIENAGAVELIEVNYG